jgi:hypothetical protein
VEASLAEGYSFIFANKVCHPSFDALKWYKVKGKGEIEYNECAYQPMGWPWACRFVVMRIPKEKPSGMGPVQIELLEDAGYKDRIFVTHLTKRADLVITEYDKRADTENLVGEAKREGLAAIPSRSLQIITPTFRWSCFAITSGDHLRCWPPTVPWRKSGKTQRRRPRPVV